MADPCLNTFISAKSFHELIIDVNGVPQDQCAEIPPNAHTGGKKTKVMKHIELKKTRFNSNYATYFYDIMDVFFLHEFE